MKRMRVDLTLSQVQIWTGQQRCMVSEFLVNDVFPPKTWTLERRWNKKHRSSQIWISMAASRVLQMILYEIIYLSMFGVSVLSLQLTT